jgi:uncharacterized membrane protein YqaE (UPF0057 family)
MSSNINNELEAKDFVVIVLSVLIPPLAVFLVKGFGTDFWLNLILTIFFYVPGKYTIIFSFQ